MTSQQEHEERDIFVASFIGVTKRASSEGRRMSAEKREMSIVGAI